MVQDGNQIYPEVSEAHKNFPSQPPWGILYNWESHQTKACPAVSMCQLEQGWPIQPFRQLKQGCPGAVIWCHQREVLVSCVRFSKCDLRFCFSETEKLFLQLPRLQWVRNGPPEGPVPRGTPAPSFIPALNFSCALSWRISKKINSFYKQTWLCVMRQPCRIILNLHSCSFTRVIWGWVLSIIHVFGTRPVV